MPYSFVEIEKRKKWVITVVFIFLVLFYFFVAEILWIVTKIFFILQIQSEGILTNVKIFSPKEAAVVFLIAFYVALMHWYLSTRNMVQRILGLIGAIELDPKDSYHQVLKNVIEEVCVATGGTRIRGCVVPISGVNAFAISDLKGDAVIGVTEGLLGRLNRSQLEAVVAHEAAHIVSEDNLTTTVTCSLFAVYSALLESVASALSCTSDSEGRREGGGPVIYLAVVYVILSITQFISLLLNMFLSRQQEYRADAVAVKLTRNPISFAEALYVISRGWRGVGGISESLAPIFIMSPDYNALEETDGVMPDLFSTHPPTSHRLSILLNMAHSDLTALKTGIKPKNKLEVQDGLIPLKYEPVNRQWLLYKDDDWQGPFGPEELFNLGLSPNSWISKIGENIIKHASADEDLYKAFKEKLLGEHEVLKEGENCPLCKQSLSEMLYEGAPILKCHYCSGILAASDVVLRIIAREDFSFSPEVVKSAEELLQQYSKGMLREGFKVVYSFDCPKCKNKMIRGFFSYGYPIQVDRCSGCGYVWFDKNELEILQYLAEKVKQQSSKD